MNSEVIKKVAIFAAGLTVGGGVGYLLAKHFVDAAIAAQEEVEYEYLIEGRSVSKEEYEAWLRESKIDWNRVDESEYPTALNEKEPLPKNGKPEPVDYAAIAKQNRVKEAIDKVAQKHLGETKPESVLSDGPFVISFSDYTSIDPHYTKVSLTYYTVDNVLADDNGVVVPSPDNILGAAALTKFGQESEDPDIVYIRNEKAAMDYEVVRVDRSYKVTVLGETKKRQDHPKDRKRKVNKTDENEQPEDDEG